MEGRWGDAGELLHAKIVTDGAEVDLAGLIRRNRRALRQAYRDAGLEHVEINGEAAKLTISWGRRGFEERDLRARRDGDGWRFASPPWGRRIVRQPGKKIVQTKPARRARTKPSYFGGFSVGGAMVLAWVGILSAFVLAVCLYGLFGSILSLARGPAIAFSVAVFAGVAAVAVIVHRRHRTRRRRSHGDPMSFSFTRPGSLRVHGRENGTGGTPKQATIPSPFGKRGSLGRGLGVRSTHIRRCPHCRPSTTPLHRCSLDVF